jgi:hypothetical protein
MSKKSQAWRVRPFGEQFAVYYGARPYRFFGTRAQCAQWIETAPAAPVDDGYAPGRITHHPEQRAAPPPTFEEVVEAIKGAFENGARDQAEALNIVQNQFGTLPVQLRRDAAKAARKAGAHGKIGRPLGKRRQDRRPQKK